MKKPSNSKCIRVFRHEKLFVGKKVPTKLGVNGSNGFHLNSELRLKEGWDELELDSQNGEKKFEELELDFINDNEATDNMRTRDSLKREKSQNNEPGMLNFDEPLLEEDKDSVVRAEDLMAVEVNGKNNDSELEADQMEEVVQSKPKEKHKPKRKLESRSGKQYMKRSSILAKQVIGIESAQSLGFISQLWVDTASKFTGATIFNNLKALDAETRGGTGSTVESMKSLDGVEKEKRVNVSVVVTGVDAATEWAVVEVEVRPNLLSSESVKIGLEDVNKVGDVVLVQEENFVLNEFRTVGLESLVGYQCCNPGQRKSGKGSWLHFQTSTLALWSPLSLMRLGYSVIPSSLVDVLEVVSDVIIVHEAAASRIQRLTKGFLGAKHAETSSINLNYHNLESESMQPVKDRKPKRKSSKRKSKFHPRTNDLGSYFELPMDYM
ncbi:Bifunctional purine biosynthesis protein PurH [Bienertia sinuspersici]